MRTNRLTWKKRTMYTWFFRGRHGFGYRTFTLFYNGWNKYSCRRKHQRLNSSDYLLLLLCKEIRAVNHDPYHLMVIPTTRNLIISFSTRKRYIWLLVWRALHYTLCFNRNCCLLCDTWAQNKIHPRKGEIHEDMNMCTYMKIYWAPCTWVLHTL